MADSDPTHVRAAALKLSYFRKHPPTVLSVLWKPPFPKLVLWVRSRFAEGFSVTGGAIDRLDCFAL